MALSPILPAIPAMASVTPATGAQFAPALATASAAASPIPWLSPVISTVFPAKLMFFTAVPVRLSLGQLLIESGATPFGAILESQSRFRKRHNERDPS